MKIKKNMLPTLLTHRFDSWHLMQQQNEVTVALEALMTKKNLAMTLLGGTANCWHEQQLIGKCCTNAVPRE